MNSSSISSSYLLSSTPLFQYLHLSESSVLSGLVDPREMGEDRVSRGRLNRRWLAKDDCMRRGSNSRGRQRWASWTLRIAQRRRWSQWGTRRWSQEDRRRGSRTCPDYPLIDWGSTISTVPCNPWGRRTWTLRQRRPEQWSQGRACQWMPSTSTEKEIIDWDKVNETKQQGKDSQSTHSYAHYCTDKRTPSSGEKLFNEMRRLTGSL